MTMNERFVVAGVCGLLLSASIAANAGRGAAPTVMRTPDGGLQPQALIDSKGVLHLIYLKGDPSACDIFYVRQEAGERKFSEPIRVNSQPNSAIAVGTIRGAQLALGKNDRVHVAWNGSGKATPQAYNKSAPMCYTRLDDSGKAFEPQRSVMQQTWGLDGGGSVAADQAGNVYVVWHGRTPRAQGGEEARQVWVARSTDEGKTFAKETLANSQPTGACGCCGLKAFVDSRGALHVLYRSATAGVNRDIYMLTSKDTGKTFQNALVQKWNTPKCTMSSEAFSEGPAGVLAAWETENQVYFGKFAPAATQVPRPVAAPGAGRERKHPAAVSNADGETLFVWTEGTGWQKGGSLAWCIFDEDGKPTREAGRVDGGIPVWGLPTAVAKPDGSFIIIH
jgi:hypothetical protein